MHFGKIGIVSELVTSEMFARHVLKSTTPVAVHFARADDANDRLLDDVADQLAGGLTIGRIALDANPELASKHTIIAPTIIVFSNGAELDRKSVAALDAEALVIWLAQFAMHGRGCACHPN